MNQAPVVTIARYRKPDGYETRFWAVYVDHELLVVTVYRKGAEAVRRMILGVLAIRADGAAWFPTGPPPAP